MAMRRRKEGRKVEERVFECCLSRPKTAAAINDASEVRECTQVRVRG